MENTFHTPTNQRKQEEHQMNVLKNFEALFVVALGLACAANYAFDRSAVDTVAPRAVAVVPTSAVASPAMPVIVVNAKRMSAAEKAQSLNDERRAGTANNG
jgi:hypothetical protein